MYVIDYFSNLWSRKEITMKGEILYLFLEHIYECMNIYSLNNSYVRDRTIFVSNIIKIETRIYEFVQFKKMPPRFVLVRLSFSPEESCYASA